MWVYLLAGGLVVIGLIGAVVGGGIFTIVLVPIGLVIFATAVLVSMWGRSAQGAGGAETNATHTTDRPLPHADPNASAGRAPTSPEGLADARRGQQ
jgi:predicted lipid-binding transport protein (Tim44 family)